MSETTFSVKGRTLKEEVSNLKRHVGVRNAIVGKAREARFRFPSGTGLSGLPSFRGADLTGRGKPAGSGPWQEVEYKGDVLAVPRDSAYDAVTDTFQNPREYSLGCLDAAAAVITGAMAQVLKRDEYDKAVAGTAATRPRVALTLSLQAQSFVRRDTAVKPEDWIPGDWGYVRNPTPSRDPYQGEHVIYLGKTEFWGHGTGINTWADLQKKMSALPWNLPVIDPAAVKAEAYRDRPIEGLEPSQDRGK